MSSVHSSQDECGVTCGQRTPTLQGVSCHQIPGHAVSSECPVNQNGIVKGALIGKACLFFSW